MGTIGDVWRRLARSRKFWLAVVGVVQSVVFAVMPEFPQEVWMAIDGLLAILIAAIAVEDAAEKLGGGRGVGQ